MGGILYGILLMAVSAYMAWIFAPDYRRSDEPPLEWLWGLIFVTGAICLIGSIFELLLPAWELL